MIREEFRYANKINYLPEMVSVTEELKLPNHRAIFIRGSELNSEERMSLDRTITNITTATYPNISPRELQVLLYYYRIDNFHQREKLVTDWWIIYSPYGNPIAFASSYRGGIERKKRYDRNHRASPRLFYTGEPEAVVQHIEYLAQEIFEKNLDFPFVVDARRIDINQIDLAFERIKQRIRRNVYLYPAKDSRLPFVDERRLWLTIKDYNQDIVRPLPAGMELIRAKGKKFFIPLKNFLNKTHPFNSLAEESLDEGIFYIVVPHEDENKILASAGLSYPTVLSDGTHLICATDLATDRNYRRQGLALNARVATLNDLLYGGKDGRNWLMDDKKWKDALVVVDNPISSGSGATDLNLKFGYTPLRVDGKLYIRRWLTAGIKQRKALLLMQE